MSLPREQRGKLPFVPKHIIHRGHRFVVKSSEIAFDVSNQRLDITLQPLMIAHGNDAATNAAILSVLDCESSVWLWSGPDDAIRKALAREVGK